MTALLTPELLDTYRIYKRKTNKVVSWLLLRGLGISGVKSPIGQVVEAANSVIKKGHKLPDQLYWDLKDAIKARSEITEAYKFSHAEDNGGHEHFTSKLKEIAKILYQHPPLLSASANSTLSSGHNPSDAKINNAFQLLKISTEDADDREIDVLPPKPSEPDAFPANADYETKTKHIEAANADDEDPTLEDDILSILVEFELDTRTYDELCATVRTYWKDVATGEMSMMHAAWLTEVAWMAVKNMNLHDDANILNGVDAHALAQMYAYFDADDERIGAAPNDGDEKEAPKDLVASAPGHCEATRDQHVPVFEFGWASATVLGTLHWLNEANREEVRALQAPRKPRDLLPPQLTDRLLRSPVEWTDFLVKTETFHRGILCGMSHLADPQTDRKYEDFGFTNAPSFNLLLHEVEHAAKNNCAPAYRSLIFGVQMHTEIYRAVLDSSCGSKDLNGRLKALTFAREVRSSIDILLNEPSYAPLCECHSNCSYLRQISASLEQYCKKSYWDLYHQSPWTAGHQMLIIAQHAILTGTQLCNDQGVVGSVMYLYSMLRNDAKLPKLEVFEDLSDLLLHAVFLGKRPTRRYTAALCRFYGGTRTRGQSGPLLSVSPLSEHQTR
ncbi:hypothetical protein LTS18_012760 [Coniosporium uncinatum]|uniref:Uncharacterized protein n=1 Tax=Coniosporium uncinatum TaxID=93489 RepID=A0ACC3D9A2_9PEZI|nr:hypothetical protein LTS18_012760 [Coniosporium uncinatum]